MKQIINFLSELQINNNREWFLKHKEEYLKCKEKFDIFTEKLIAGICEFDNTIGPLTAKDCTYRIYRDIRFSQNKTPYKTHFGCFIVPGGKKSGFSGYYFQIGANDEGFPGGCMLAVGDYCCDPKALKIIREDISNDDEEQFFQALNSAKGFVLDFDSALKKVPKGFVQNAPYSDLLRLKNFCLVKSPGKSYMLNANLLENVLIDFKSTMPFLHFINRAIEYSKSNNP